MTDLCANGWPVLNPGSRHLRRFTIPGVGRVFLRDGSAGFILAHFSMYFSKRIEPVIGPRLDDWGYAYRKISGSRVWSNHAGGVAIDLNALQHPRGKTTFTPVERAKMTKRIANRYSGVITPGFNWDYPDDMHFEIGRGVTLERCEQVARRLMDSSNGVAILRANPGLRQVIMS